MATRIKQIIQPVGTSESDGAQVQAQWLTVYWADANDNEGTVRLPFDVYGSIEAEWAGGQGVAFTAITAALDTELATVTVPDDDYSTPITSGKDGYSYGG